MAVVTKWLGVPVKNMYDGTSVFDWNTDTIKASLTTSSWAYSQDTHDFYDDVTNELSGGGYVQKTLQNCTVTYDTATDEIRLDADDLAWTSFTTTTARVMPIWKDGAGASSADPLISYTDFGADQTVSSGTLTVTFDSTGVLKLDAT